jgi:hypothetical protein
MDISRAANWWFTSRVDGQIVVAQLPNPALGVWLAATLWRFVGDPTGQARSILDGIAMGALLVWALDELIRGVNPFRRALGLLVLIPTLVGTISRIT